MKRRAFTLVEIMIVVLIIGILLSIAVPQWMKARSLANFRSCVANLRQISNAKDQYAIEAHKNNGDPCVMTDLVPNYITTPTVPSCTEGGTYNVQVIGTNPTCTIAGTYPHVLP